LCPEISDVPQIVQLSVFSNNAPTPNTIQSMGALISQGATTLTTGSYTMLPQKTSLASLLAASLALTSLTWSGGTVTATTAAAIPGLTTGDVFITAIAGATPSGYNGTYLCTVTGTNTFTFSLTSNPGTESVAGTYTPPNQQELIAANNEFFTQGTSQAVYVLELGAGDGSTGPTALGAWITANPGVFSAYLTPRLWDTSSPTSPLITLAKTYTALNALTYFFVTTTTANWANYTGIKSVCWFVPAPGANTTLAAFDCASLFQMWLATGNPSVSAPLNTFGWRYSYGTTAWPQSDASTTAPLDTAYVNYITNANTQAGINQNGIANGYMADGFPMQYRYAADWLIVNLPLNLSNAIVNAANNNAPLDYDQSGIDTLQDNAVTTMTAAGAANILNGPIQQLPSGAATGSSNQFDLTQAQFTANFNDGDYNGANVVNAVPFQTYIAANPSTYKLQQYGGFSAAVTPMVGLQSIIFNLTLNDYA
jgi:hypothetical protein